MVTSPLDTEGNTSAETTAATPTTGNTTSTTGDTTSTTGNTTSSTSDTTSTTGDTTSTTGDTTSTTGNTTSTTGNTTFTTGSTTSTTGDTTSTTGDEPCMNGSKRDCYNGPPGTKDIGMCVGGIESCVQDEWTGVCSKEMLPETEICNGIDDDCDGNDEALSGAPIKVGTGTLPRLISYQGFFVGAWVDLFGKVILQRINTDGGLIGPPLALIVNGVGVITDIELAPYAGGIAFGYSRSIKVNNKTSYESRVSTFDANLNQILPDQRLKLGVTPPPMSSMDLVLGRVGGGSQLYFAMESIHNSQFNKDEVRITYMPQGMQGSDVELTMLDSFSGTNHVFPTLLTTDLGIVSVHENANYTMQLYGWGPAGNQVWAANLPLAPGIRGVSTYTGVEVLITKHSQASYRRYRVSEGDGALKEDSGWLTFLDKGGAIRPLDSLFVNNQNLVYECGDGDTYFARFDKAGVYLPYEAIQPDLPDCKPTATLRMAEVGGMVAILSTVGNDINFAKHACP